MSRRLAGFQEILFHAVRCFATLHTGERVYYRFRRGEWRDFPVGGGIGTAPYVFVSPETGSATGAGWYPMSALWFEMPNGEVVK